MSLNKETKLKSELRSPVSFSLQITNKRPRQEEYRNSYITYIIAMGLSQILSIFPLLICMSGWIEINARNSAVP